MDETFKLMKTTNSTVINPMRSLLLTLLLLPLVYSANAGQLYKWEDENGQIRYSDRLPPTQVKKRHQQISTEGVVLKTTEAAATTEARAEQAEVKRKQAVVQAEADKIQQAQDKRDQMLLRSFSSEDEILLARDGRLNVINSVRDLIKKNIATTEKKLTKLQKQADDAYLSKGKQVPGGLAQRIEHFTRRITNRHKQLEHKNNEVNKLTQQFDANLSRYRELASNKN